MASLSRKKRHVPRERHPDTEGNPSASLVPYARPAPLQVVPFQVAPLQAAPPANVQVNVGLTQVAAPKPVARKRPSVKYAHIISNTVHCLTQEFQSSMPLEMDGKLSGMTQSTYARHIKEINSIIGRINVLGVILLTLATFTAVACFVVGGSNYNPVVTGIGFWLSIFLLCVFCGCCPCLCSWHDHAKMREARSYCDSIRSSGTHWTLGSVDAMTRKYTLTIEFWGA